MVGKSAVLEARVVGKSAAGSEGGGEICCTGSKGGG